MEDKTAIIRGEGPGGAARDAYEELKNWAIDDLKPHVGGMVDTKLKNLAREHGTTERDVLKLLMRPPAGESRPRLIEFLYNSLFS